jgi:hypothetical protein
MLARSRDAKLNAAQVTKTYDLWQLLSGGEEECRVNDFVKLANLYLDEVSRRGSKGQKAGSADAILFGRIIEGIQAVSVDVKRPIDPPDKMQRHKMYHASLWLRDCIKTIRDFPNGRTHLYYAEGFKALQARIDESCTVKKK